MDQLPQNHHENTPNFLINSHFGDCYFSRDDGLAESKHIFVAGNRLQDRCGGCREFHIGETGFGTGLNLLATLLSLADQPVPLELHWWSVEKYPLSVAQISELLCCFSPLEGLLPSHLAWWGELSKQPNRAGWHLGGFQIGRVHLQAHIWFGDVLDFLGNLPERIDAWMLDGHSPALNPDMWSPPVFAGLAAASHPPEIPGSTGLTTLATYTVAGLVKRGLREAGFTVVRCPGHGRKRHMLTGTYLAGESIPGQVE